MIGPSNVTLGNRLSLLCNINASMAITQITWIWNYKSIANNSEFSVNATKKHAGSYQCSAENKNPKLQVDSNRHDVKVLCKKYFF